MPAIKVTYMTLPDKAGEALMNVGDRVIYHGARNIMHAAIGPHQEEVRFLSDDAPLPPDTDIVVVCGTPQIANTAEIGQNLTRIAQMAESDVPVRINLGAGAFYFDAFEEDRKATDEAFALRVAKAPSAAYYSRYKGFDLCTCRDMAGDAVLRTLDVQHAALPCPGFFSSIFQTRPLFRRPQQMISVLNATASFWNRVDADVHRFYRQLRDADPSRIFVAHDEQDVQMLNELGIPHVSFADADSFIEALAATDSLISLRVHGALPAWTLGLDVTLLGIDRRAMLGQDFGALFRVVPLRTEADFARALQPDTTTPVQDDRERRDWLQRHLGEYVRLIRGIAERKLGRPMPPGVPLHAGGAPEPLRPQLGQAAGQYFTSLFHSRSESFTVPLPMLRSNQEMRQGEDALHLSLGDKLSTLSFGPYIRIPRGRWRLRAELVFDTLPKAPEQDPNSIVPLPSFAKALDFKVTKGVPARELAVATRRFTEIAEGRPELFELDFDNPSDTGEIEAVFSLRGGRLPGGALRILPMQLTRLPEETPGGVPAGLA
jgi:hypothetical protein